MPRKAMPNMKKTTVLIPNELFRALEFLAKKRGSTYSQLLRDITREYVVKALLEEKALAQAQNLVQPPRPAPTEPPHGHPEPVNTARGEPVANDGGSGAADADTSLAGDGARPAGTD